MKSKQRNVTVVQANESDCKAILQFVNGVNADISHYVALDPFSIVRDGKIRGRLIRQTLFDGRYCVYQIIENSGVCCGILITARGEALRGKSRSLIFYLLKRELCVDGMRWATCGDGGRVIAVSDGLSGLNIEEFGFCKIESVSLANGCMEYYALNL